MCRMSRYVPAAVAAAVLAAAVAATPAAASPQQSQCELHPSQRCRTIAAAEAFGLYVEEHWEVVFGRSSCRLTRHPTRRQGGRYRCEWRPEGAQRSDGGKVPSSCHANGVVAEDAETGEDNVRHASASPSCPRLKHG
jgi:hypothetical protein